MKVLVTGGAGFIGSNLVDGLLNKGYEVVVLDNFLRGNKLPRETLANVEMVRGDVRDADTVTNAARGCGMIYHLAAYLGVDIVADNPVETMETEALGTRNIANAAVEHGVEKLIYASTSGVYGKAAIEQAVNENFDVSPSSSYAIAKRYNEIYLKGLHDEKNLQCFSLRYFNVYGPRQDTRMVIPRFMEQAIQGKPITVFGSGQQTRDFTYIDDVVGATIAIAETCDGCEVINIANGQDVSVLELAERIVKISGSSSEIRQLEPPPGRYDFEVQRRCGDSAKMRRLTDYDLVTPLDEGLAKAFAAYKSSRG